MSRPRVPHPSIWRVAALLVALTGLVGCDAQSDSGPAAPRPVKVVTVEARPISSTAFAGVVSPRVETDLAFRTLGRVIARKVSVGDLVSQGDLVAQIDPLALRLAVTSAEAELRNAQATLDNAVVTERRKRTLSETNAGSVADLDLAVQTLKSAQATLRQSQASLDKAREQLGYAELRAEFDGVVSSTSVEVGQVVTAGQTVLRLARLDQRDVVLDVPEADLAGLPLGTAFTVALQLDPSVTAPGTLREIAPQAEATTRTHRIKVGLDQPTEMFRLGTVVSAVPAAAPRREIRLPASALLKGPAGVKVWVADPRTHTVATRAVTVDESGGGTTVSVLDGLEPGEQVVVAGVHELTEGQDVRLGQEPR